MKNKRIALLVLFFYIIINGKSQDIYINKFTNINPVSYTDVIYKGIKDTVLVSTYSGRIAKIINGNNKETIIASIPDEIYSLAYHPKRKEIAAATLENGIVIIDEQNGKIVKKLPLQSTWSIAIFFSDNFDYLFTSDFKGNRYLWDVYHHYKKLAITDSFPKGSIVKIDAQNIATIVSPKSIIYWDINKNRIQKEIPVALAKFQDMDKEGNFLSIDFNECSKYDANTKTIAFKIKHPNWPLPDIENEKKIYDIPYSMQLTSARFAKNKIFTSGIDRTIRVWDKQNGKLLTSLTKHTATVNKIKISKDETQIVSVDLKGGIAFWSTE